MPPSKAQKTSKETDQDEWMDYLPELCTGESQEADFRSELKLKTGD